MKNKFDVIIVGAGPAGLKCAEQFKGSNYSVLLIERNKVIGPKVCAGGLTRLASRFDLPESKTRVLHKASFYLGDKKYEFPLFYPVKIIDRYDLGQFLLKRIENMKNLTILKGTTAKEISKDKVITNKGEFYYKYLVGADGSLSIVRRFLGLEAELSSALYYKIPKITSKLEAYFRPKLLGTGYIWVFPHKDYTNIGVGTHNKSNPLSFKELKKILEDFLKKHHFDYSNAKLEAAPINTLYEGCFFKNVFLIGDAAGLLSRLTGAGIAQAMISGQEIGRKIIDPGYNLKELRKILRYRSRQEKVKSSFDKLPLFLKKRFMNYLLYFMRLKWFQENFLL